MAKRSALAHYSIALSAGINHTVAARFPNICPFIMVSEFPRSGGNWIRDMLGDCMQMPVPRFSKLPITFSALAHSHFPTPITQVPAVYILRDGRDVFVSHYWKSANGVLSESPVLRRTILSKHPSLSRLLNANKLAKEIDHAEFMRAYYSEWKVRPMGSKLSWGEHVTQWLINKPDSLAVIRYEDMHSSPQETLHNSVLTLTGEAPSEESIDFAINRNSFRAKTGRDNGQGNNQSNRRRGIVGDWKNVFAEDFSSMFQSDFGHALALGGYQ